jgi:alpha-beta hydrolase superfamily lysophospholipase
MAQAAAERVVSRSFNPFSFILPLLPMLALLAGCAGPPTLVESRAPPPSCTGVVFVIDGAGGYQNLPHYIADAVHDAGLQLEVRSFDWTHERGLGLSDEIDVAHSRNQGRRLAQEVVLYQGACLGAPVYVLAYSAGCAVALAAAESVPLDGLERVILLAPSVSVGYDLRPALAGARQGIDVFISARDRFWLGVGTAVVGTSDGRRQPAAGRVGFQAPADPIVGRLHQHPWDPSVAWTGNAGGHAGTLQSAYLKAYVLPLLSAR